MGFVESQCARCGGSGWVIVEKQGLSAARRCECSEVESAARTLERARIPINYQDDSFDNFSHRDSAELRLIHTQLAGYVRDFPNSNRPDCCSLASLAPGKPTSRSLSCAV